MGTMGPWDSWDPWDPWEPWEPWDPWDPWDHGTRDQGPGTRDQGPGTRDQGPGTRGPGTRDQKTQKWVPNSGEKCQKYCKIKHVVASRNSAADPPDPPETQHPVRNRPWVPHAGGQDDGSLHKLPQIKISRFSHLFNVQTLKGGRITLGNDSNH